MQFLVKRFVLICGFLLWLAGTQTAAAASEVSAVRFSQRAEAVRIVFDVDTVPEYKVLTEKNGTSIVIEMPATNSKAKLESLPIKDALVKSVKFSDEKGVFKARIDLERNAAYKVNTLKNPNRFYIDIVKNFDQKISVDVAVGLKHITIVRSNEDGMITAHVLDIDPKEGYRLKPALARGKIVGREALLPIASANGALAAVNASYFSPSGEILGVTKIDSTIVSTTYLPRSAFGLLPDGKPLFGQIEYKGGVYLPDGSSLEIGGVNCERGENALILYNSYYDSVTKTNIYGREFVVKDNKVVAIGTGNTPIPAGALVVSAHGTSADKLAGVKVGDAMNIVEDLGDEWNKATQIIGVGPTLVKNNSVYLTTKAESFGSDVAGGRAPRTAVGRTQEGHILLAVVDGRQAHSRGFTLLELALFMQEMGAVDAINFDGGGSSEMVVKGQIANQPSDGGERSIGSALVVLPK